MVLRYFIKKGDYRVVLVRDDDTVVYYSMVRLALEEAIVKMDKEFGIASRDESESRIYYRKLPGAKDDEDENDDDDGDGDGADNDENGDDDDENKEDDDAESSSKPACW